MKTVRIGLLETLRAATAVTSTAIRLRYRGLEAAAGRFVDVPESAPGGAPASDDGVIDRRYRALLRTHRLPWSTCLTRSIALCMFAAARDRTPKLVIGTRRDGDGLAAHAWVSFGGRSWGEDGHEAMIRPGGD